MFIFDCLQPEQLTLLSSIIGVILADDLTTDQQNVLGNVIINIGQAIVTVAAAAQSNQNQQDNQQQINNLCQQIDNLNHQMNFLKNRLK